VRIVLSGYYGFDNAGDEAILYSIILCIREIDSDASITVLSNNPYKTKRLYGVDSVNRWNLIEITNAINASDVLVSGGGSLLQDITGVKSLAYYLGVIAIARMLGKPVFLYAHGVGPLNSSLGRLMTRAVVNKCATLLSTRDEQSKQEFLDIGIQKNIEITADPVLSIEVNDEIKKCGIEIKKELGITSNDLLIVSVRSWSGCEKLYSKIAECCDEYVRSGGEVLLLPLHFPHDLPACQEVARRMENDNFIANKNYTVQHFLGIFYMSHIVIAMRLHALIMACVFGKPIIGISYDPKVDRFLYQVGLKAVCNVEQGYIQRSNTDQHKNNICSEMKRIIDDWDNESKRIQNRVAYMKERSRKSAEMLFSIMQERKL